MCAKLPAFYCWVNPCSCLGQICAPSTNNTNNNHNHNNIQSKRCAVSWYLLARHSQATPKKTHQPSTYQPKTRRKEKKKQENSNDNNKIEAKHILKFSGLGNATTRGDTPHKSLNGHRAGRDNPPPQGPGLLAIGVPPHGRCRPGGEVKWLGS